MHRTIAPATLCALAGLALMASACQQPLVNCTSAHSPYLAYMKLKKGDAESPCGSIGVDIITLNTYFQEGGLNGTPDYDHAKVAITSTNLAGYIDQAEGWTPPVEGLGDKRNAIGDFSTGKPVDEFCVVDKLAPVVVDVPELPTIPEVPEVPDDPETPEDEHEDAIPEVPGIPAQSFRYDWSKLKILVTADAQGTQLSAHLKYTENGCVAEYDVFAVSPPVECEGEDKVEMDGETVLVPNGKPDQTKCDDESNGLNPSFATKCDADLLYCVITTTPPVYRE
ncbi:MAG: hypothetical protein R3B09_34480 [Nannocystaceae bacterium]